ncbi:MAG: S-(hydroxymethyl)glutathione dehydrogenase / alcohol dehydrogenase, partial [Gaiellaceae bacterium]|nr:S-(hydroxymethyl)glutathione dehydrogenase / alcohol dehydrogenase [Gaiellaceae bacterium]
MKIRAAVLEEFGAPLEVQELDLAEPKAGEVLVRLVACGVCHTDLYTASGADPSGYAPTVLGHEGAGVVERVGDGVSSVSPGDHVVTLFSPQCRECIHCLSPRTNLCLAIREQQNQGYLPDGTTRLSRDAEPVRHFMGTSTFAEYTVMPEIALAKVDPEAPFEHAALFACGLSTGLGAAMFTARVEAGSTCVVFGAGMVGLGAVAGCRLQGAERIVCVDMSEDRLALARGQGATETLSGGPDVVAQILERTGGFGADYTFEATGQFESLRRQVDADDPLGSLEAAAGHRAKPDHSRPKHHAGRTFFHFRGIDRRAEAGGEPAGEERGPIGRGLGGDLGQRDLRHHRVLGERAGAHEVAHRLAVALQAGRAVGEVALVLLV